MSRQPLAKRFSISTDQTYRGRIAPTPTGYLHLGHAATFYTAWQRCCEREGTLIYRDENLDPQRCKTEFSAAAVEDLRWLGLDWDEGPDCGGPHAPYCQSKRMDQYLDAWKKLRDSGWIYPSTQSRRELREAAERCDLWERVNAPHEEDEAAEPLFPKRWRPEPGTGRDHPEPGGLNWRFRVPDSEHIQFTDVRLGPQSFRAGEDFGDFLVWRRDGVPAYELAVVVDDSAMGVTEVVRGEDLLKSTARQLLMYRVLGASPPAFYHCPLLRDKSGKRLAKRNDAMSLRKLRKDGLPLSEALRLLQGNPTATKR